MHWHLDLWLCCTVSLRSLSKNWLQARIWLVTQQLSFPSTCHAIRWAFILSAGSLDVVQPLKSQHLFCVFQSAQQPLCHRTSVSLACVSTCTFVSLLSSCSSQSRLKTSAAFLKWDCGTAWNGNSTCCVHRTQGSFCIHNSCAGPAEGNRRSPGLPD